MKMPMLSWSIQGANKAYRSDGNPRALVPQIMSAGYLAWVMGPDGCPRTQKISQWAPGSGLVFDRPLGLEAQAYDIGPYAGVDGRRAECWPTPLAAGGNWNGDGFDAAFNGIFDIRRMFAFLGAFVGSPPCMIKADPVLRLKNRLETLRRVLSLRDRGLTCIFDTGGVLGVSDAWEVFGELSEAGVDFLLEPTRPRHQLADMVVGYASGLVSLREVHETARHDTEVGSRAWYDDAWLARAGLESVVWYTDADAHARFDGAMARLRDGGKVLVALRGLSEWHIRELHAAASWATVQRADATKADAARIESAGGPKFEVGGS